MAASGHSSSPLDVPLYLGLDCSTQQLKAILITPDLKVVSEARVDFDAELGAKYGVKNGTHYNPQDHSVYAPVAMWLDAIDLVLGKLVQQQQAPLHRIAGISGAGIQHSAVFWGYGSDEKLASLQADASLSAQISYNASEESRGALSWPWSPNWQDASTQKQCDQFDALLGSPEELARVTGSKAHHRFTGPQILRFRETQPSQYAATKRISLVSSFLASVFLGKVAPIDVSDVCGMNLWDLAAGDWADRLLTLASGGNDAASLREKLGPVVAGNSRLGRISPYFVHKYGFSASCTILPFTGDNPSTILSLPLRENDAIVSLGTSTTFLTVTPKLVTHPSYHMFNSPTTRGEYMFMLCYKNGGLARERVRDSLPASPSRHPASTEEETGKDKWAQFNRGVLSTPPLGYFGNAEVAELFPSQSLKGKLGLYFPLREIVPNVSAGTWRYTFAPGSSPMVLEEQAAAAWPRELDARVIVESQLLSIRLRSQAVAVSSPSPSPDGSSAQLPAQPRRIYLVGGGSENPSIQRLVGQVLGGTEGVWKLNVGGAACALGGAHKALWALESLSNTTSFASASASASAGAAAATSSSTSSSSGKEGAEAKVQVEDFASLLGKRWAIETCAVKVDQGYREAVWRAYGDALPAFDMMEQQVLSREQQ